MQIGFRFRFLFSLAGEFCVLFWLRSLMFSFLKRHFIDIKFVRAFNLELMLLYFDCYGNPAPQMMKERAKETMIRCEIRFRISIVQKFLKYENNCAAVLQHALLSTVRIFINRLSTKRCDQ